MTKLLTRDEVCEILTITERTLYRIVERREIAFIKVGGSMKFTEEDVEQYLQAQRIEAHPASVNLPANAVTRRGRPPKNYGRCEYVPGMKVI